MSDQPRTIFRRAKDRENPYAMIDRQALENPATSWKAKGLLAYLLSRPDDWQVILADLVKRSTDGEHATRSAVNELIEQGHLVRDAERDASGKIVRWVIQVHEIPQPHGENPHVDFPHVDNPHVENRVLLNTDYTETKDTKGEDRAQAQKPRRASPKASAPSSPSEPDAPKPQKISDLPAAQVYREITHTWPKAAAYADLAPINNGGMQRWRDVVHEWVLRGYNPANLRGMLEWYKAGIPTRTGGNQGQQRQSGVAAVEAFKQMVGLFGDDDSVIDVEVK